MRMLDLVEKDCTANTQRLGPVPLGLLARARQLVKGVKVYLNAPVSGTNGGRQAGAWTVG